MKVSEYIKAHPKTILAQNLAHIPQNTEIKLGSGLITDNPQSNLQKAMAQHGATNYVTGGRAGKRANDGYHFAIILP